MTSMPKSWPRVSRCLSVGGLFRNRRSDPPWAAMSAKESGDGRAFALFLLSGVPYLRMLLLAGGEDAADRFSLLSLSPRGCCRLLSWEGSSSSDLACLLACLLGCLL